MALLWAIGSFSTVSFADTASVTETFVTLKSVDVDSVYKKVNAYLADGTVKAYFAVEGYVIFGWASDCIDLTFPPLTTAN